MPNDSERGDESGDLERELLLLGDGQHHDHAHRGQEHREGECPAVEVHLLSAPRR